MFSGSGSRSYKRGRKKDQRLTSLGNSTSSFDDDDRWASLGSSNSGSQQNLGGDITTHAPNENDPRRESPRSALESQPPVEFDDEDSGPEVGMRARMGNALRSRVNYAKDRFKGKRKGQNLRIKDETDRDATVRELGVEFQRDISSMRPDQASHGMLGSGLSAMAATTAAVNSASMLGVEDGIEAVAGSSFRRDQHLPQSTGRMAQEKSGQGVKVIGHSLQAGVPIVGGILASPFAFVGEFLESRGQGLSVGQSLGRGGAKAGVGAAVGAIPIYGQIQGGAAFANDIAQFLKPADYMEPEAAIQYLETLRDALEAYDQECQEQENIPATEVKGFTPFRNNVEKYLRKYRAQLYEQRQATSLFGSRDATQVPDNEYDE